MLLLIGNAMRLSIAARFMCAVMTLSAAVVASQANADESELVANELLLPGQQIVRTCYEHLEMQFDGNLVLYGPSNEPLWHSGTIGVGGAFYAVMQTDGNFVIYDHSNRPVWDSGTWRFPGSSLRLQSDSNLVLYDTAGVARWASNTQDDDDIGVIQFPCSTRASKTSHWRGWNLVGGDYQLLPLQAGRTAHHCAFMCSIDARCKAYSFVDATRLCSLKDGNAQWAAQTGTSAGIIYRVQNSGGNL